MEVKNLKQRDMKTLNRIISAQKSSQILKSFFDKGFKSFEALKSIVQNYYPEIDENRLYDFWHIRIFDSEIIEVLESVFDKLKIE
jgi:hypothetical protein